MSAGSADAERGVAVEWSLRLSWLVLLLDPPQHAVATPLVTLLAAFGVWLRVVGRHPLAWALATLACAASIVPEWSHVDNHDFLRAYWCLALALATGAAQRDACLATSARGLLAAVFGCALVWKLALSPDFVDGRFFEFVLATDPRLASLGTVLGGLPADAPAANRVALGEWMRAGGALHWQSTPRLGWLAGAATVWVLAVESALALAFAAAAAGGRAGLLRPLSRGRDGLLAVFALTTYAVAPVTGFGWLLAAMGLAQAESARTRRGYAAVFGVLLGYHVVPWAGWLQALA